MNAWLLEGVRAAAATRSAEVSPDEGLLADEEPEPASLAADSGSDSGGGNGGSSSDMGGRVQAVLAHAGGRGRALGVGGDLGLRDGRAPARCPLRGACAPCPRPTPAGPRQPTAAGIAARGGTSKGCLFAREQLVA